MPPRSKAHDMAVLGALLLIVAALLGYFVYFAKKVNEHWKNKGVPHKTPMLFFGNSINAVLGKGNLMNENRQDVLRMFPKAPLVGYYDFVKPTLIVNDLDLVQKVLIKDFSHFNTRPMNPDEEKFPELVNLSNMTGKRWKSLRNKMIPVFTTGKLRLMFEQMSILSDTLLGSINPKDEEEVKSVDLKKLFNCYSMDIIGSTAFGIEVGTLKDSNNEFARIGRTAFGWNFTLRFMFMYNFPSLSRRLGIGMNSPSIVKYYSDIVKQTLAHRVASGGQRNDFVNLMLTLKEKGFLESGKEEMDSYLDMVDDSLPDNERVEITENLILSNAFLFIMAGFEPVGTVLSHLCFDLSQNVDKQEKLRNEILKAYDAKKGVFNYDTIRDTPYMEMCVKETMRLHTVVGIINRECSKEYTFPGTNVTVKPGEAIEISSYSIHMNPEIYREPEKFIPERFGPDVTYPPCTWLPFGDGPRICIAMRFVITEVKCAMAKLLLKYDIRLNPKTVLPIKPKSLSILYNTASPMYFDLIKRPEH
uniref:Putative cytochrome P450 6a20 n=3 Tax=Lygus hesperus TaxID=30085 RepID=A0A0A9X611_LYGHE